jgi:DNA invertase Pin-like site-specific DNA recombinase
MVLGPTARVALYVRVSTLDKGQDPETQLRELREYAARRKWTIAEEYVDTGVSGAKTTRPRLDELMKAAHRGKFEVVLVWKFDRFARSVSHLLRALEDFQAVGIEFCSYSEQLDTSTAAGRMVFTVLGAVAELERSLIVERVKAGLRNAKAKGKRLGRPRRRVNVGSIRRYRSIGMEPQDGRAHRRAGAASNPATAPGQRLCEPIDLEFGTPLPSIPSPSSRCEASERQGRH